MYYIIYSFFCTSEKLQHLIQLNQDLESVEVYNEVVQYSIRLEPSACTNLKTYVNQTTNFWFKLLKEKLQKYFSFLIFYIQILH